MLSDMEDAFGHEIMDHLSGRTTHEIVERDDGFVSVSDGARAYFAPYEEWSRPAQTAIHFARGRVLDVGVGAGRVALYLQQQGREVIGIDNSPLALEVCRRRGVRDVRLVPITQIGGDLGTLDTVVMFGNNFGLFGNPRRARWLLRRWRRLTSPDACIIAQSNDIYRTSDPDHLAYHARNRERGRMSGQVRIRVRYRRFATPWFDYLLVSPHEMHEIIDGTGWHVEELLKDEAPMYVAVIRKEQ